MDMLLSLLLGVDAALQPYVRVDSKAVVLEHVRVIDGTGAPAREDQTLYLVDGKIAGQAPAGAQRLDLQGRTVMPAWSACTTTSSIRWVEASLARWPTAFRACTWPPA